MLVGLHLINSLPPKQRERYLAIQLAAVALWAGAGLWTLAFWLRPKFGGSVLSAFAGTVLVLLLGTGLFFLKKYYLKTYALAEIGFALSLVCTTIRRTPSIDDTAGLLAVFAAAYLVVRGLTNYEEGKKQESQSATQ